MSKLLKEWIKYGMAKPNYTHCLVIVIPLWKKQIPYAHFWAEDDEMAQKVARAYAKSLLALPRMKRLNTTIDHLRLVNLSKLRARRTK